MTSAIVNICGSTDMGMHEYDLIVKNLFGKLPDDISIIMSVSVQKTWLDSIQVTVLLGYR